MNELGEELSVTFSSKYHVPVWDKVPVDVLGVEEVVQLNELPRLLYPSVVGPE